MAASLSDQLAASLSAPPAAAPAPEPTKPPEPAQAKPADPTLAPAKPTDPPAAPPEKPKEPEKALEEPKGAAYARIAKLEREARQAEAKAKADIAAERAKLDAERAAVQADKAAQQAIADTIAKAKAGDPQAIFDIMQATGWDAAKLSAWRLSGQSPAAIQSKQVEAAVDAKVKALQEEMAALRKAREDEKKASEEQALQHQVLQAKTQLSAFIDKNPKYELIKASGEAEKVFDAMFSVWQQTGQAPTFEEACDLAESNLEKQAEALLGTTKFKTKLAPPAPEKPPEPAKIDRQAFAEEFAKTWTPQPRAKTTETKTTDLHPQDGLGGLGNSLPPQPNRIEPAKAPVVTTGKTREQLVRELAESMK